MSKFFSPPIVYDVPTVYVGGQDRYYPRSRVAHSLFRHYSPRARGRTVIKVAGVYSTVDTPSQTLLDTASEVYLGGHVYEVTDAVATALAAAGYTTWATPEAAGTVHGEDRIPDGFPWPGASTTPNQGGAPVDPDLRFYLDTYADLYSEVS